MFGTGRYPLFFFVPSFNDIKPLEFPITSNSPNAYNWPKGMVPLTNKIRIL